MVKPSFIRLGQPELPEFEDSLVSGLPLAELLDSTEGAREHMNTLGEVDRSIDMVLPNFSLRAYEGTLYRDALLVNQEKSGGKYLGSCFFIESKLFSHMPGYEESIDTFNRSHNFKYDPQNEAEHYLPAHSKLNFIHFSYRADFINEILPDDEKWADNLRNHFDKQVALIGKKAKPISLWQDRALHNIFNCQLKGKWAEMMIESSFAQLLYLQMNALFNQEESTPEGFTKKDMEVMHALKDHLNKTFLDDHSMVQLGRHFGINTNKLMSQFKKLFGMSVFEYLTELRMEYASQLLTDKNMMVVEVAQILGYKNPNHFSAAFKKRFGIIPSVFSKV